MIVKNFGERVKYFRIKQNLSQEELAIKSNLHRTYIGMVERFEKNPTLRSIAKIAVGLNIKIHELLEGLDDNIQP